MFSDKFLLHVEFGDGTLCDKKRRRPPEQSQTILPVFGTPRNSSPQISHEISSAKLKGQLSAHTH